MTFYPEIKQFIKNIILFMIVLALIIHFSWGYILSFFGFSAEAYNDNYFEQANINYIGNVATALSLNFGGVKNQQISNQKFNVQTISIAEVMSDPSYGEQKLIESNMQSIKIYAGILKQDINRLLDQGRGRLQTLEDHISLLKSYETKGQESLGLIQNQKSDLQALINDTENKKQEAKNILQNSYQTLTYDGVEKAINTYLTVKDINVRAKIYMIYLKRFDRSYAILQQKNKILQNVLIQNKEAIAKDVTVVIPEVGAQIVKELGLIETQSDQEARALLK
ncbi:hypothetical protein CSB09_00290 [Candidatus Gracilibacteria bacterium]|nr:MAG: hypothetical protein CSB09_00290 [Candidatus Gracilibacteria bacterium]